MPVGYRLGQSGQSIVIRHDQLDDLQKSETTPQSPIVMPLGSGPEGTWSAILHLGSSVINPRIEANQLLDGLVRACHSSPTVVLNTWTLGRGRTGIEVIAPYDATNGTELPGLSSQVNSARQVDLTIFVDSRALTIHPHGLVINSNEALERIDRAPVRILDNEIQPLLKDDHAGLSPGDLEIKLLTVVPWIDGLQDPLPAKRARRAIELVAYLAVHHPDPISSDRLRSRVLGTHESDHGCENIVQHCWRGQEGYGYRHEWTPVYSKCLRIWALPAIGARHHRRLQAGSIGGRCKFRRICRRIDSPIPSGI